MDYEQTMKLMPKFTGKCAEIVKLLEGAKEDFHNLKCQDNIKEFDESFNGLLISLGAMWCFSEANRIKGASK